MFSYVYYLYSSFKCLLFLPKDNFNQITYTNWAHLKCNYLIEVIYYHSIREKHPFPLYIRGIFIKKELKTFYHVVM